MSDDTATTDDSRSPVACTITDERAAERADWMTDDLVPAYAGYEERADGVTVRFDGTDDTLGLVARFVAEETECCAFADYRIDVQPPFEETRLTITGPDGTTDLFVEEFAARMAGDAPLAPPSEESRFRRPP